MHRPEIERTPVSHNVPLANWTTLKLGGPARDFTTVFDEDTLIRVLRAARDKGTQPQILGGGSNLVIGDRGVEDWVIHLALRGRSLRRVDAEHAILELAAGESWDAAVGFAVAHDLSGIECLSGIPGLAGATPIQNVGAYGQEVAQVLEAVRVVERGTGAILRLSAPECGFGYRSSVFKRDPTRWIVLSVELRLSYSGPKPPRNGELARALDGTADPSAANVRAAVLAVRRRKSMVLDPHNPNSQSAGSFFTNPIVDPAQVEHIQRIADAVAPQYPESEGIKLAAAWLIEQAGIVRGYRHGGVGVSRDHALALVHYGGGSTRELLTLAAEIRSRVYDRFGVNLEPEPILWGDTWPWERA